MNNKLLLLLFVLTGLFSTRIIAGANISAQSCTDFSGTGKAEQNLKNNIKSGNNKVSAVHSLGKLLGNRLRQNRISTWVAGYVSGYGGASGKVVSDMSYTDVGIWLKNYCSSHASDSLKKAAVALYKEKSR